MSAADLVSSTSSESDEMSADDSSSTTSGARDTQYRRRKAKPVRLVDAAPRAPPNGTTKRARGGDDQASAQVKRARKPSRSKLASAMDAFVGETADVSSPVFDARASDLRG